MTDSSNPESAITRSPHSNLPSTETPLDDWGSMAKAFEGMCKAGLALAVGFSVASAFCKMMDSKGTNIPNVINKLAGMVFNPEEGDKPRTGR